MANVAIGKQIQAVVKKRGMKVEELAKRLNVSKPNIYDIYRSLSLCALRAPCLWLRIIQPQSRKEPQRITSLDFFTVPLRLNNPCYSNNLFRLRISFPSRCVNLCHLEDVS
jgi:hypothetical protein